MEARRKRDGGELEARRRRRWRRATKWSHISKWIKIYITSEAKARSRLAAPRTGDAPHCDPA